MQTKLAIKVKGKNLYYSNKKPKSFYPLSKADLYDNENGVRTAMNALRYWFNQKEQDGITPWCPELHRDISSLDDLEVRTIELQLQSKP